LAAAIHAIMVYLMPTTIESSASRHLFKLLNDLVPQVAHMFGLQRVDCAHELLSYISAEQPRGVTRKEETALSSRPPSWAIHPATSVNEAAAENSSLLEQSRGGSSKLGEISNLMYLATA
jgi:hypothetical protein